MRPHVKLRGMTRVEDVRAAVEAGVTVRITVLVAHRDRRVMPSALDGFRDRCCCAGAGGVRDC